MDYILRKAIPDPSLGFCISTASIIPTHPIQTRRKTTLSSTSTNHTAKYITDFGYADDLALSAHTVANCQSMLDSVGIEAKEVGLLFNVPKTKFFAIGCDVSPLFINGVALECVDDFKYLGSWIISTKKDLASRKIVAWQAILKMNKVWKSVDLTREFKLYVFTAVIESILLYWTLTKTLEKSLDGCYTKLLRYALNIHWSSHTTNATVYRDLPLISYRLLQRRLTFAGHCFRSSESAPQPITDTLFLDFPDRKYRVGQQSRLTYLKQLLKDCGRNTSEINQLQMDMKDRLEWSKFIKNMAP